MNTFASIKLVQRFNKVNYYTVKLEEDDVSLFEKFVQKHQAENFNKLQHIMSWIKIIGSKYGAYADLFRPEGETADAAALPPIGTDREPTYIEIDNEGEGVNTPNNLRLYCFRANENVVFLFNGDIKTALKAQNCDNVRPHFRLANAVTNAIEIAFKENEIRWNEDSSDIRFEQDFELNW